MPGRIFHLNESGDATPMDEHPYDAENTLQDLLAKHPDLLAGEQIDSANLQAGRVRLVFISDTIPPELRRIVEFLNEQMGNATTNGAEKYHNGVCRQGSCLRQVVKFLER